jgi:predicted metal-dependent hydrolase
MRHPRGSDVATTSTMLLTVDDLEVEVTRKRIRRAYLGVHPPDARVTVSAPLRTSDRAVRALVRDGRGWIDRHRRRILAEEERAARSATPRLRALTGETWTVRGRAHDLEVVEGSASQAVPRTTARITQDGRIVLHVHAGATESERLAALERLLRRHLRAVAWPMMDGWAGRLGVEPRFLGIRRMRTQWGSCVPARARVWLSLELVTRRDELIEYVIVHELLHFHELSHGARFEALMDEQLPHWRSLRDELDGRPAADPRSEDRGSGTGSETGPA